MISNTKKSTDNVHSIHSHMALWILAFDCCVDGSDALGAILHCPHIVCLPPCWCAGSVAGQESSGASAQKPRLVEELATSQTTMGGPIFSYTGTFIVATFQMIISHKKKTLRKWTVYVHLDFLVPKRRMKLKIWLLRFAACRGDTSIGHTIYISCAERRIAPWSQRAFHNRPRRHHPAPDCVDFVCVYVQLKTHPIASITSAIWHTSVSLFRL